MTADPSLARLHRRTFLIDREFQLKYAGLLLLAGLMISAGFAIVALLAKADALRHAGVPEPVDPSSPAQYMEKVKLMYDLARLSFETDSTRAITLMLNSVGTPVLQIQGATITDGYHNLSHHGKAPDKLAQLETMAEQGLVVVRPDGVEVTAMGWFFVRGIAMVFDRYLQADRNRARFSRII